MLDKSLLKRMLSGRIVLACVGNELRGDDGIGPFVSHHIETSDRVQVINCGETPENYLGVIASLKPEKVVIIDAAQFGGLPGEIRIVSKSEITGGGISTHDAMLTLFAEYIENETGAETFFLTIQPSRSVFGEQISPEVKRAGRELAEAINEIVTGRT